MSYSLSPLAKRLLITVLAMGLFISAPVLAQEGPAGAGDSPQPIAISVLTNRDAAVLIAGALGLPDAVWQGLFSDVGEGSESAKTIEALALEGVVKGNLDGTFRPDEVISRGEFAIWLDRAFFANGFPSDPAPFTDIPEGAAYADAAHSLYAEGVTRGCSVGSTAVLW